MEKRLRRNLVFFPRSFPAGYPLNLWVTLSACTARRRPVTEHCERTGEEAEWSLSSLKHVRTEACS